MPALPSPPKRPSGKKSAFVASQILGDIESGQYPVGSRLPSEPDLAGQMGVSRNAIREALATLQILGVTEGRVGDGTYVVAPLYRSSVPLRGLGLGHSGDAGFDVWEARKEIEITIARMATRSATEKALERIRYHIPLMAAALGQEDYERYLDASKSFHLSIARAADNALMEEIIEPIIQFTEDQILTRTPRDILAARCRVSLAEHQAILKAIEERDEREAMDLTSRHFDRAAHFYSRLATAASSGEESV